MNFKLALSCAIGLHVFLLFLILENRPIENFTGNYMLVYLQQNSLVVKKNLGMQQKNISGSQSQQQYLATASGSISQLKIDSKPSSQTAGDNKKLTDSLVLLLHNKIQSELIYPISAELLQQHGTVRLGFFLHKNGLINQMTVIKSSGYSLLDKAALDAVQRISLSKTTLNTLQQDRYFVISIDFY